MKSDKIFSLRLSFRGEATYANFAECISYAKKAGIKEISTLTNGGNLFGTNLDRIITAGIDWITVSIDGLGETYEKIRKPITFEKILNNIKEIHNYKLKNNLEKPLSKQGFGLPLEKIQPITTLLSITDLIAFNPLIDYLRKDELSQVIYEENFSCPQLQRLTVVLMAKDVFK